MIRAPTFRVLVVASLLWLGVAAAAHAQIGGAGAAQAQADTDADVEGPAAMPVYASASFSHYLGQGTFIYGPSGNPYLMTWHTFTVGASFGVVDVFATHNVFFEWTKSDYTTTPHQLEMIDPWAGASARIFTWEAVGLSARASAIVIPGVSITSRQLGRVGGAGAGVSASWTIPFLELVPYASVQGTYQLNVPQLASRFATAPGRPLVTEAGTRVSPRTCIVRNPGEIGNYACSDLPSIARSTLSSGLSYSFFNDAITLDASLTLLSDLTGYWGPDDEYTSPNARPGPGLSHQTMGILSATYAPLSWFSFSVGTFSGQGLWTYDGKFVRFPFWDFIAMRDNYSTFYVDTTFSF